MLNIFFDRIPEEISKIEEQELCSEAESIANIFLDTPGNPSNWETGQYDIINLGFSRDSAEPGIDYNKWTAAINRTYYNVTNERVIFIVPRLETYNLVVIKLS